MNLKFYLQQLILFLLILVIGTVNAQLFTTDCRTPNRDVGLCVDIKQCAPLLNLLRNTPLPQETKELLRQSQCGQVGLKPKVCCPKSVQKSDHQEEQIVQSELLPNVSECGMGTYNRIYGGNIADIGEFPFMALLEYQTSPNDRGFYCGGVLINKRYVLTAAHCVIGKDIPKTWKLDSVRLGEHDISTNMDCVDFPDGKECSLPPVNVRIEQAIPHPNYKPSDVNQHNDIALLRLAKDVEFTDFVGPICLPQTKNDIENTYEDKIVIAAGWGKTKTRSGSTQKLKAPVLVINNQRCNEINRTESLSFSTSQICAGSEQGKYVCRSDSGGPLMILNPKYTSWYAVGVLAIEPESCDLDRSVGVYTRVGDYMNWLVNTIQS